MSKVFGTRKPTTKKPKVSEEESLAAINNKLEALGISKPSKPKYHIELPNGQTIVQTSPKNCSHCFWCRSASDEKILQLGLPVGLEKISGKFICEGSFCSPNCAMAFCYDQSSVKYRDSLGLLFDLLKRINGEKRVPMLKPSQDWKLLLDFGGPMELEIFHKERYTLTKEDHQSVYDNNTKLNSQTFVLL
jgi:hypothetical protein